MNSFAQKGDALVYTKAHETLKIRAWGKDGLRIQATKNADFEDLPSALLQPAPYHPEIVTQEKGASIQNGQIKAEITEDGRLLFWNVSTGKIILEETPFRSVMPHGRFYLPQTGDLYQIEVKFVTDPQERIYGLGQHPNGALNQKGYVIDLVQRNTQVNIPFLVSSKGYGFLWNNPGMGRVELSGDRVRWVADSTFQIDYYISIGKTYADILERYAEVTGFAPMMPAWAAGFWQCKLRYQNQEELLEIAREYKRRGLPLSVIVVDFFHWTKMGEWKFDPEFWPDPAGMVRELEEMGVKVMVSIWPTVNPWSENYEEMQRAGYLVRTERGVAPMIEFADNFPKGKGFLVYYDSTHPEARKYIWEKVKKNYFDNGIRVWWLDAMEPEIYSFDNDHLRYHAGHGTQVTNIYPLMHAQAFYEGMRAEGETEIISLCRSAWAGSQRYGSAVWSGDIQSTFEALQQQVRAGLNIGMSGIPWWTTDIGGFMNADTTTPTFRELIVRWFQFGVFCPLFRLHGYRLPRSDEQAQKGSGGDNEVWSFGEEAYTIIKEVLFLRERMRPYIMEQMKLAHESGTPPMRPLFFDFSADEKCYEVEDQFMFGPDILVAPVLVEGARSREVYLPAGSDWQHAWTGEKVEGGQTIRVEAPLDTIPVFFRWGTQPLVDSAD